MAKVNDKLAAASSLTLRLFEPGMSRLHRAGLGGLACTLEYIRQAYEDGALDEDEVPGGPGSDGTPPWTINADSIVLDFGRADAAREYLRRLFRLAFNLRDGVIYLPGQYGYSREPSKAVRAELQQGLLLTFLQHGKTRGLAKDPSVERPEVEGEAVPPIEYRECSGYKHQDGWEELAGEKGLTAKPVEVAGPLSPGAMVRHNAYTADTRIEETVERALPLYFAMVGCLALSVNRGVGVLVVPEVADLTSFIVTRPLMTPRSTKDCRIASAGDAALQAQVRVHRFLNDDRPRRGTGDAALRTRVRVMVKGRVHAHDLPGASTMMFMPTPWASQQKSRTATLEVPPGDERRLNRFAAAIQEFPPRLASFTRKETTGRGSQKKTTGTTEHFWADSIVRPLVADNLASDRPWYAGFTRLMTALDQNNKPLRDKLSFERKGLHAMSDNPEMFDADGEAVVIQAVHEAIRQRYGRIAEENPHNRVARENRWKGEYDRWRLAFAGSKTGDQFRGKLCDLFSRGGNNRPLREKWASLLPLLRDDRWQLTRDLALLALASYASETGKSPRGAAAGDESKPKGDA